MDEIVSRRRLSAADGLILAALTGLLFCVYLITASLTFVSDDELYLFDLTESLAKRRSVLLSETADLMWPGEANTEPIQPLLAAPIYLLANGFSGIGNVHATLLFNPMLTALTGGLLYLYLRQVGFTSLTSAAGALAFGLTTIAWPYTKTFFREPLATFTLFGAAYCLLCWRNALAEKVRGAYVWLIGALAAGLISMFTKEGSLIAAPALLLILLPERADFFRKDGRRTAVIVLAALALAGIGLWIFGKYFNPGRFNFYGRLMQMWSNIGVARQGLAGYIFSPGKSLFVYSPVLLLALGAPFIGDRRRRLDTSWPLALMIVFVVTYALTRGELWWGGTNWGPRYMVPLTPFLIVSAASAIDWAIQRGNGFGKLALAGLAALGVIVQIGGLAVKVADWDSFVGGIKVGGPWTLSLWEPYYSPVLGHWRLITRKPPDFAWVNALPQGPAWIVPLLAGGLAIVFAVVIGLGLTRTIKRRLMLLGALAGFAATGAVTWLGLHAIYYDQRYHGSEESLHQLNAALAQVRAPDPVIFLNNRAYFEFMLNYYKGDIVWYTLELNPNELLQPGEPRPPAATDPFTLVNTDAWSVVNWFARKHQTALLVMEHGPFTPESPRPMEWWMSREFFYESAQEFSPVVRLVQFSTAAAPKLNDTPAHATNYQLGDSIALVGWDAQPDGTPLRSGSVLNLSTQWKAIKSPGADYKIGTYLITPQGTVAVQVDSIPVNGFWPTTAWQTGNVVRQNVAFVLPKDLAPGFYEVWTLMYSPVDGGRLPVQDASGTAIRDHIVLFNVEVTR